MPKFIIEQLALYPTSGPIAKLFLAELGLNEWIEDHVTAEGRVHAFDTENQADLSFNYQAASGSLELEVLSYTQGWNWMASAVAENKASAFGSVSHLGMHVTEEQLAEFAAVMDKYGIHIAQEVKTTSHTNPHIKDSRRYKYVIYDTRGIIGVDLKFIIRLPYTP